MGGGDEGRASAEGWCVGCNMCEARMVMVEDEDGMPRPRTVEL